MSKSSEEVWDNNIFMNREFIQKFKSLTQKNVHYTQKLQKQKLEYKLQKKRIVNMIFDLSEIAISIKLSSLSCSPKSSHTFNCME